STTSENFEKAAGSSPVSLTLGRTEAACRQKWKETSREERPAPHLIDDPVKQKDRTPLKNFAPHKLVTRRVLAGLSTDELAEKARLWGGMVEGFEEGRFPPYVDSLKGGPSPATRLARALGCTVEDFQETPADSVSGDLVDEIE